MFLHKFWPLGVSGIAFLAILSPANSADNAAKFGREGTVKIRVPANSNAAAAFNGEARIVADYGSFAIWEVPAGAARASMAASADIQPLPDENQILLNAGPINTTLPAAKQLQQARGAFAGKSLHLIQFAGRVQPGWYDELVQTGVEVVTYIPSNSYLVYGTSEQIARLQTLSIQAPHIQWDGAYLDDYKIDPSVRAILGAPAPAGDQLYAIQLVADPVNNPLTQAVIDRLKSAPVLNSYNILGYVNIVVSIPADKITELAKQPDIVSIHPTAVPAPLCERQDQIVAGNLTGGVPDGPGYLNWLTTSQGFSQDQFDVGSFAVDVSDSGIDNGTSLPNHFGLYVGGDPANQSRVVYNRPASTLGPSGTLKGCDGHGNLNAHIICGFDDQSDFPHTDSSGFHFGLGVCPFVRVGSTEIFGLLNPSLNYSSIQSRAYADAARISSNSWGLQTFVNGARQIPDPLWGHYTIDSQAYDALARDAQPAGSSFPLPGNQEMVIVFANGNDGEYRSANCLNPPATAKNVISVGAAENVQPFGENKCDNSEVGDSGSDNANDIIRFSSRGPTTDGRHKPDIVAPGTHVSGGVAQADTISSTGTADSCYDGSEVSGGIRSCASADPGNPFFPNGQQFFTASSGTSHACPAVSGACALIRQFFINQKMAAPSPAMTKALLINSARFLTGNLANDILWSNNQGMGEMNLGEAFKRGPMPTLFRDEVPDDILTATGQTRVFAGQVADSKEPLRITLAWTDAPGSTSGAAYKNDLDLTVKLGPNTYNGNVFGGPNSSVGGSADTKVGSPGTELEFAL